MLSFFKKKAAKSEEAANGKTMKAYLTGKVIPIEEVNDGVFSAKIMGDGIAIIPENEVLTAPADGEITVVMDGSFHAVGMGDIPIIGYFAFIFFPDFDCGNFTTGKINICPLCVLNSFDL